MKRLLTFLFFFSLLLQAENISPLYKLHTSGFITDFVLDEDKIYVATDAGNVDIFLLGSEKMIRQISLEAIRSGRGELMPARINRVDRLNGKTLIVSISHDNFRDVWIEEDGKLTRIINAKEKLLISEAHFIDDNSVMFATFDSDLILYNLSEGYKTYSNSNSQSTLCDLSISSDHKKMVSADESGRVKLYDVRSGNNEAVFESENVDKVYSVAYHKGVIITGGEDRRVAVYQSNKKPYHLKTSFLVYAVGLSPDAQTGIYADGEEQVLQLFNTQTKKKGDRLVGHKEIVSKILFVSEKALISSGEGSELFLWRLH